MYGWNTGGFVQRFFYKIIMVYSITRCLILPKHLSHLSVPCIVYWFDLIVLLSITVAYWNSLSKIYLLYLKVNRVDGGPNPHIPPAPLHVLRGCQPAALVTRTHQRVRQSGSAHARLAACHQCAQNLQQQNLSLQEEEKVQVGFIRGFVSMTSESRSLIFLHCNMPPMCPKK